MLSGLCLSATHLSLLKIVSLVPSNVAFPFWVLLDSLILIWEVLRHMSSELRNILESAKMFQLWDLRTYTWSSIRWSPTSKYSGEGPDINLWWWRGLGHWLVLKLLRTEVMLDHLGRDGRRNRRWLANLGMSHWKSARMLPKGQGREQVVRIKW